MFCLLTVETFFIKWNYPTAQIFSSHLPDWTLWQTHTNCNTLAYAYVHIHVHTLSFALYLIYEETEKFLFSPSLSHPNIYTPPLSSSLPLIYPLLLHPPFPPPFLLLIFFIITLTLSSSFPPPYYSDYNTHLLFLHPALSCLILSYPILSCLVLWSHRWRSDEREWDLSISTCIRRHGHSMERYEAR